MAPFKNNSRFGGDRRPFNKAGSDRPFRGDRGGDRELYDAECNSCHDRCQVPFRPNGKKPVYCTNCFKQEGDRPREREQRFSERKFEQPRPPVAPKPDPRIDELARKVDLMQSTLERLAATLEAGSRKEALGKEVRKHVPAARPADAPKKAAKKAPAKKVAKKTPTKKR
ncbi:MAG TPA: CxxC-x17-CxxC domain-containing protein [Candidatus Paceibacterota bacterium]